MSPTDVVTSEIETNPWATASRTLWDTPGLQFGKVLTVKLIAHEVGVATGVYDRSDKTQHRIRLAASTESRKTCMLLSPTCQNLTRGLPTSPIDKFV